MVVLSSPSGAGKTTITKKLQQKYHSFKISVSHTTRSPRSNEIHGIDYFFISNKKFEELIEKKKFYEYAKIFENYYGTLKKNVDESIITNDLIFDIDWQGTKQLSNYKNLKLIKIFLITWICITYIISSIITTNTPTLATLSFTSNSTITNILIKLLGFLFIF